MKKLLVAVSLSIVLSSFVSAQTPTSGQGEQGASERGPAEPATPEPAGLTDEYARPEVTPAEKEAFHAIAASFTLRGKGKTEEARKKAAEVLRLLANTGSYRGFYMTGLAQQELGNDDSALADFDRVIKLKPWNADPYVSRGDSHSSKGDYGRAVADYSEAIRLEPTFTPAYQNGAKAYEKLGESAKAQADREKAAELERQGKKP